MFVAGNFFYPECCGKCLTAQVVLAQFVAGQRRHDVTRRPEQGYGRRVATTRHLGC